MKLLPRLDSRPSAATTDLAMLVRNGLGDREVKRCRLRCRKCGKVWIRSFSGPLPADSPQALKPWAFAGMRAPTQFSRVSVPAAAPSTGLTLLLHSR